MSGDITVAEWRQIVDSHYLRTVVVDGVRVERPPNWAIVRIEHGELTGHASGAAVRIAIATREELATFEATSSRDFYGERRKTQLAVLNRLGYDPNQYAAVLDTTGDATAEFIRSRR